MKKKNSKIKMKPALQQGAVSSSAYKYYAETELGKCRKNKDGHTWETIKCERNVWIKMECIDCRRVIVCELQ